MAGVTILYSCLFHSFKSNCDKTHPWESDYSIKKHLISQSPWITHSLDVLKTCLIGWKLWLYCRIHWLDFLESQGSHSISGTCWLTSDSPPVSFLIFLSMYIVTAKNPDRQWTKLNNMPFRVPLQLALSTSLTLSLHFFVCVLGLHLVQLGSV